MSLNRGGALRWWETRVIPGRLPRQEEPPPFLDSQFTPCKAPRPHILPRPLVVSHNLPARVSSCGARGSQQPTLALAMLDWQVYSFISLHSNLMRLPILIASFHILHFSGPEMPDLLKDAIVIFKKD